MDRQHTTQVGYMMSYSLLIFLKYYTIYTRDSCFLIVIYLHNFSHIKQKLLKNFLIINSKHFFRCFTSIRYQLTVASFSLEWGKNTLFIAENQLPFFPMFLALLSLPVEEDEIRPFSICRTKNLCMHLHEFLCINVCKYVYMIFKIRTIIIWQKHLQVAETNKIKQLPENVQNE